MVPPVYSSLHAQLEVNLGALEARLAQEYTGAKGPTIFSSELMTAHSGGAASIGNAGHNYAISLEADRVKAMGCTAVSLTIGVGDIASPWVAQAECDSRIAAYRAVIDNLKRKGLKVIIQTVLGSANAAHTVAQSIGLPVYVTARANVAKMIAREFTPDYLFLGNEPDMEALATGYPFRDLNTVLWVYNYIIQQVAHRQRDRATRRWHRHVATGPLRMGHRIQPVAIADGRFPHLPAEQRSACTHIRAGRHCSYCTGRSHRSAVLDVQSIRQLN